MSEKLDIKKLGIEKLSAAVIAVSGAKIERVSRVELPTEQN